MLDLATRLLEVKRPSGRVYQTRSDHYGVAIDWIPRLPILGCKLLTEGQAKFHPTEGRVVYFPQALRRRRGTTTIAVRTSERPDLRELFDLAITMERELTSKLASARVPPSSAPG